MMTNAQSTLAKAVFDSFTRMYGVQKMGLYWAETNRDELLAEWQTQLQRFSHDVIGRALQALNDRGDQWPPSMPEFVGLCRDYNRTEHKAFTAVSYTPTAEEIARAGAEVEKARREVERLRAGRDMRAEIGEPAPANSIIGRLQAAYRAEESKRAAGRPNKQWAYVHMIQFADGAEKHETQVQMANQVCKIGPDDMATIRKGRVDMRQRAAA